MAKLYNAGIYCRLSVDDANNSKKKNHIPADESASIENQRLLLSKFCMLNGWIETKTYTDDGYSGGNFNRPGFRQMVEDARAGIINLVLVKDLSRLGRDYIEVGRYTDILFPSWGCRFVSILDELDTARDDNDMLHFRSLMNDYHLRDLSGKIKSVYYAKARNGQVILGRPPYGYVRSGENKHQLLVEDFAAGVVRRIFDLRTGGMGYAKIAGELNATGIPSPRDYWNDRKGKPAGDATLWKCATIRDILRCEAYIGHWVNCTEGTVSYKDKRSYKKPESEWIRHENVHEPIIGPAVWEKVRELDAAAKEAAKNRRKPEPSLFSKKLFCMDCGSPMVSHPLSVRDKDGSRHRTGTNYHCARHSTTGRGVCSWHSIAESALKPLIISELLSYSEAVTLNEPAMLRKLKRQMNIDDTGQQNLLRQEVKRLSHHLSDLGRITADLYEGKVTRKISETTFATLMDKYEQERQARQAQYDEAKERLAGAQEKNLGVARWTELIRRHTHPSDLCRADVDELIDRIEVGESDYSSGARRQEVRIYWRFVGCLAR
jgi:DNA invertase Pin-like site-specific DNA recombinase